MNPAEIKLNMKNLNKDVTMRNIKEKKSNKNGKHLSLT